MKKRLVTQIVGLAIVAVLVSTAGAADRMLGVVPSDGTTMLVKAFAVAAGTVITGAQFENNDPASVFPEAQLIRGPVTALNDGEVVASATNLQEVAGGLVSLTWPSAVTVTEAGTYYVGLCMPNGAVKQGPGQGPAIGSNDVEAPNGSYVTECSERVLLPLKQDLTISLVTSGGGQSKAGVLPPDSPSASQVHPFLRVRNVATGVAVVFGLEQSGQATVGIYDVTGRRVCELVRAVLPSGEHVRVWDGRDEQGTPVASGVYFAKLQAQDGSRVVKIVRMR